MEERVAKPWPPLAMACTQGHVVAVLMQCSIWSRYRAERRGSRCTRRRLWCRRGWQWRGRSDAGRRWPEPALLPSQPFRSLFFLRTVPTDWSSRFFLLLRAFATAVGPHRLVFSRQSCVRSSIAVLHFSTATEKAPDFRGLDLKQSAYAGSY